MAVVINFFLSFGEYFSNPHIVVSTQIHNTDDSSSFFFSWFVQPVSAISQV